MANRLKKDRAPKDPYLKTIPKAKVPVPRKKGRSFSGKITLPEDVKTKLRELRSLRRVLTRPELEYIVSMFDLYLVSRIQHHTGWTTENIQSMRRRLFRTNSSINSADGYSAAAKFLKLDTTLQYFTELNKKRGFQKPLALEWLLEKLDLISYRYNCFDESKLENVRIAFTCPPRSGKSLLLHAFIFKILLENPQLRILYISNNQSNIKKASSNVRNYLRDVGVVFSSDINNSTSFVIDTVPNHTIDGIVCSGGMSCYTPASVPQGENGDIIIVDDILSSTEEAHSELRREKVNTSFFENIIPRLTKFGVVVVVTTRYDPRDLVAIITDPEFPDVYQYKNIPAITVNKDGVEESYWPQMWSVEKLNRTRRIIGERAWHSLYMGNPKIMDSVLFPKCARYEGAVPSGCQYVWACDLAYSTKSKSDNTALVKMSFNPATKMYYVSNVYRWKANIEKTLTKMKGLVGDSTIEFCYGGTESVVCDLSKNYKLKINGTRTTTDKYQRALPLSASFNNVLFHEGIADEYIREIEDFDGSDSNHDDVVDAVITCFNYLSSGQTKRSYEEIKSDMSALFSSHEDDDED